jgi:hypothetical protein
MYYLCHLSLLACWRRLETIRLGGKRSILEQVLAPHVVKLNADIFERRPTYWVKLR